MNKIQFSIIVPIYNVEDYLVKCIESVIYQTYDNFELILVNDGSKDKCPEICDEYSKIDKRIRVIHKDNGGLSDARNFGLKAAKGEYIMFIDSDDYIEKDACEKFNFIIENSLNVDVIAANIKGISGNGFKNEMYTSINGCRFVSGSEFIKIQLRNNTMYMSSCRNIYKREFLVNAKLYFKVGILHEDEQWTPRVFLLANKIVYTEYIHYIRVLREGSITRQKNKTKNALDLLLTCKELKCLYVGLKDEELKCLLFDYLVTLFLNAFFLGKLFGKKYNEVVDERFLIGMSKSRKNKLKVKLFCFNKYIYYFINRCIKKINFV